MFDEEMQRKIMGAKLMIKNTCEYYVMTYPNLPWQNIYLTGGAIASRLQDTTVNDWDFYCVDKTTSDLVIETLKKDYMNEIADADEKYSMMTDGSGKLITAQAITMKDKAQFISMIHGEPKEVKYHFDYLHCTPHYDLNTNKLYISEKQFDCIVNKVLVVNNPKAVTPWRKEKFLARGYTFVPIFS